jgi:hypothetical protein
VQNSQPIFPRASQRTLVAADDALKPLFYRHMMPMSAVIQLRLSKSEKPTVAPGRAKNEAYRTREYLTEREIERLLEAARASRATRSGTAC